MFSWTKSLTRLLRAFAEYTHIRGMVYGRLGAGWSSMRMVCPSPSDTASSAHRTLWNVGHAVLSAAVMAQRLELSHASAALCRVCRGRVRESEAVIKEQGTGETGVQLPALCLIQMLFAKSTCFLFCSNLDILFISVCRCPEMLCSVCRLV